MKALAFAKSKRVGGSNEYFDCRKGFRPAGQSQVAAGYDRRVENGVVKEAVGASIDRETVGN